MAVHSWRGGCKWVGRMVLFKLCVRLLCLDLPYFIILCMTALVLVMVTCSRSVRACSLHLGNYIFLKTWYYSCFNQFYNCSSWSVVIINPFLTDLTTWCHTPQWWAFSSCWYCHVSFYMGLSCMGSLFSNATNFSCYCKEPVLAVRLPSARIQSQVPKLTVRKRWWKEMWQCATQLDLNILNLQHCILKIKCFQFCINFIVFMYLLWWLWFMFDCCQ